MSMAIHHILERKRDGGRHDPEEIETLIRGVVDGSISRPQAAAWLAFAYLQGLDADETVALTHAMVHSGETLSWEGIHGPFVDKHSTGGVGDKVSLVLAPLWVELGRRVPMISGRGLGHTGGTLDKLEAIPGYRCDLPGDRLRTILEQVGCFINGQTAQVAPADRLLYALRNEVCTVPSIALITASILSKKVAEGIDALVLDVKVGSGAFMKDLTQARALAESLVRVGNGCGVRTRALLTDMSQPLGLAIGNALEVREAVDCLKGGGPPDLAQLTCALVGDPRASELLVSGAAYERFQRMVAAHGGDLRALEDYERMAGGAQLRPVLAPRAGWIVQCDAMAMARAAFDLGAGRSRAEDPIHPGVGLQLLHKRGERVEAGEPLAELHHADRQVEAAAALAQAAFVIADEPPTAVEQILDRVD